jgi:hypothetical protein
LTVWTGPEGAGQGQLVLGQVHSDDRRGAGGQGAQHAGQTDAAEADHHGALTGANPCGVHHRTDPGQDRAAEQGGLVQRQLGIDLDQGPARDDGAVGEGRAAEVVVEGLVLMMDALAA